jgi:hypothetical protein
MQTDRQLLTKLEQAIRLQEKINNEKGVVTNPRALEDSSDEEGSRSDDQSEGASLESRIRMT